LENGETFLSALHHREGFFIGAFQVVVTIAASVGVIVEFLPALFLPILPFGYALIRRKHWLGVGLLVAAVVTTLPFFVVFGILLISVKFR
jgi:hypothetical protein